MTKPAPTSPHQLALPRMPSAPDDPAQAAQAARLRALLLADARRPALLRAVAALALPDCWIAAGFVRNAVWDHLAGARRPRPTRTSTSSGSTARRPGRRTPALISPRALARARTRRRLVGQAPWPHAPAQRRPALCRRHRRHAPLARDRNRDRRAIAPAAIWRSPRPTDWTTCSPASCGRPRASARASATSSTPARPPRAGWRAGRCCARQWTRSRVARASARYRAATGGAGKIRHNSYKGALGSTSAMPYAG